MKNKVQNGRSWEMKVKKYIEKEGLTAIDVNYYSKKGEIDLVAIDKDTLVFIEVKYRSSNLYGYAEETITKSKIKKIYYTAIEYANKIKWSKNIRFDVVAITKNNINWIKNSFWGDEIGI